MFLFQGRNVLLGLATLVLAFQAKAAAPEAVPGEYLVKIRNSSISTMDFQVLGDRLGGQIVDQIKDDNIVVIQRPVVEAASAVIETLKADPMIEYIEPNFIYRINALPNDPSLGNLWGMRNTGQADSSGRTGTAGVDIGAEQAWDIETGSTDTLVAVIDTGVDYTHPDLKDNMWVNVAEKNGKAGVDDDNNGFVDDIYGYDFANNDGDPLDDHGHGSHCSGTIGAKGNDGAGIVGVNWNTRIMAVKFLAGDGSGTLANAVKSIDYATKMGARIMSNSWGGGGYSQALFDAISRANDANALFVAAAGNSSSNNDSTPNYPSNYAVPNVLAVAAIDNRGQMASFSSYGKKTVHVAAPGVNIYSSIKGGGYDSWSGTSMATPHVSGIAALVLSHEKTLSALDIKARIIATAKPAAGVKGKVSSGGIANAYLALTNQQAPPDPNDPANWQTQPVSVSSAHPYADNANETYEVKVPNVKHFALYFSKFDTERTYDKVTVYDASNNVIAELSGSMDDSFSPVIEGTYAKIVFTSDRSVNKYGFDITKVAYQ